MMMSEANPVCGSAGGLMMSSRSVNPNTGRVRAKKSGTWLLTLSRIPGATRGDRCQEVWDISVFSGRP